MAHNGFPDCNVQFTEFGLDTLISPNPMAIKKMSCIYIIYIYICMICNYMHRTSTPINVLLQDVKLIPHFKTTTVHSINDLVTGVLPAYPFHWSNLAVI